MKPRTPFSIPRSAAFMPLHRESRFDIREPQTIRTLKRRERRAPKRLQLVTNRHQLKTVCLCIRQLVTTCHRLNISLNLGNLIPSP